MEGDSGVMVQVSRWFSAARVRRWASTLAIGSISIGAGVLAGFDGGWIQGVVVGCAVPAAAAGLAALRSPAHTSTQPRPERSDDNGPQDQ
jgi:hypothetical protein